MKNINWNQFEKDIKNLANKIKAKRVIGGVFNKYNCTKILAISKGGLIPAYYLARYLGIKYVSTLCVQSYTDENNKIELSTIPKVIQKNNTKGWLIVDDIVDSGETMKLAKSLYPNSIFASVYKKDSFKDTEKLDFYAEEVDGWLIFPWET